MLTLIVVGLWVSLVAGSNAQQTVDQVSEARMILQQATQTAEAIPDDATKTTALRGIAQAKVRAGDAQSALQIAKAIQDESQKAFILGGIARAQAEAGDVTGALQTVDGIKADNQKVSGLAHVAVAQAKSGDKAGAELTFKEALRIASAIRAPEFPRTQEDSNLELRRVSALREILKARAASGDAKSALEVADAIKRESSMGIASTWISLAVGEGLRELAKLQVALGDVQGALQTADRIKGDYAVLRETTVAQARAGDAEGALRTARTIGFDSPRTIAFAGIATAQADRGDVKGSFETLETIKDDGVDGSTWRASALAQIAKAQAKAGDRAAAAKTFDEAIRTVEGIRDQTHNVRDPQGHTFTSFLSMAYFRAVGLAEIAESQARAGDKDAAARTFEKAFRIARAMPPSGPYDQEFSRPMALYQIADAQAAAGDAQSALETADSIESPEGGWKGEDPRVETLRSIARSEGIRSERKEALAWISKLTSPAQKAYALLGLPEGILDHEQGRMPETCCSCSFERTLRSLAPRCSDDGTFRLAGWPF